MLSREDKGKMKDKLMSDIFDVVNQTSPFMNLMTNNSVSPDRISEGQFKNSKNFQADFNALFTYAHPLMKGEVDGIWVSLIKSKVALAIDRGEITDIKNGGPEVGNNFREFVKDLLSEIAKEKAKTPPENMTPAVEQQIMKTVLDAQKTSMINETQSNVLLSKQMQQQEQNLLHLVSSLQTLQGKCEKSKDNQVKVLGAWLDNKVNAVLNSSQNTAEKHDALFAISKGMEQSAQNLVARKSRTQEFFKVTTPGDQLLKDIRVAMPKDYRVTAITSPEPKELKEISEKLFVVTAKKSIRLDQVAPESIVPTDKPRGPSNR